MKALIADGEWMPRKGYPVTREETACKRARTGSQVWRNTTFDLRDVDVPAPKEGEVLIRVRSCGVCGSDTHLYEKDGEGYIKFSGLTKLPCILGHEFSGVVEKAGPGVSALKKGDHVAVESVMWCGMCLSCRSGAPNQCRNVELLGLSHNGAFAEYIAVPAKYCWDINPLFEAYGEEDAFDVGSLIEPVGCAYNGMFIAGGGFKPGAAVVVYGTGPIGLGAVALARASGASLIVAFDVVDERMSIAKEMGADFSFNINKLGGAAPAEKVLELTRGEGADMQVEAAGAAPLTVPEMEKSLSGQGKIIYLGRSDASAPMSLDSFVTGANQLVGARGHTGYGIFPNIIKLISSGRLSLEKIITSRYTFPSAVEALKSSSKRIDGKIIVRI
ncbi:MAG: alcohol dehydrogenase catalytic domain-containing protein [Deltaproteobacteria bacterium]|nr:alcohol dehydrogenase catalytic domain-containing protein [Deltaproteobacteria bacterium]